MCARVKSGATIEDTQALWLLSRTSFPSILWVLDMCGGSDLGRFLFSDLNNRLCYLPTTSIMMQT